MRTLLANLRYSLRALRKSPGLTTAVLLTLMLGIGATTAVYTVVYATLIAPLPYPDPQQLVIVWSRVGGERNVTSAGDFLDWQRQNAVFQQLAAWDESSFNLSTADQPEQIGGRFVSPGYFNLQGIPLLAGRDFLPEEGVPGRNHVAILTHKLWSRLGGDRGLIGRTLQVNGAPYTVVGVLAPGLADRLGPELIAPLAFTPDQINHDYHWLVAMGRLKPGVSIQQAQRDMDAVTARIAAAYPKSNTGWGASVEPLKNDFLPPDRIRNLWLLLGAVGFVLLITCVNIANLLLARGAARQREIAIRSSMGASRASIFTQFLTESLLLAVAGGALGVALGAGLLRGIVSLVPEGILPSEANFHLDPHVLGLALALTALTGLLFGCAPAWYASRVDPAETLKSGARTGASSDSLKLRRLLIVSEFALALSLLAGAGLAIHSFLNLNRVDIGVRTDHVLTFRLDQPNDRFKTTAEMTLESQRLLSALHGAAGVSSAAALTGHPMIGPNAGMAFDLVGGPTYTDPSQRPGTTFQAVSPGYLKTFGIDLLQGRPFSEQDTVAAVPVAMVNQEFADHYLKGLDPLRQRVRIEQNTPGARRLGAPVEWQIVGVFRNVRYGGTLRVPPEVNVPLAQSPSPSLSVGVRTALDPAAMTRTVAAAVHSVDPAVALAHVRTMDQVKEEAFGEDRFTMRLFAAFAALALVLAAVGIYGLMAYSVSQRTQEIGLRLALGAARGNIALLVLREAATLALLGLTAGLAGAILVGRTMRSTLYGVGTLDLAVLLATAALLLATALLASWLPARRAAAIDPMQALRTE